MQRAAGNKNVVVDTIPQVEDNPNLLKRMVSEYEQAPQSFRATARWDIYSKKFYKYLLETDLKDFRSRKFVDKTEPARVLASFGAVDTNPANAEQSYFVGKFEKAERSPKGKSAVSLHALPASRVGNPEGFEINGNFFTLSWVNFYHRYAFVSQYFDFKDQVIVEIGPGSGKMAHMLKMAHPELTIVLFDLPTQAYVCNQYLKKVFEGTDEFIDYEIASKINDFDDIELGKITLLPNWKLPIVTGRKFDLFWNAASLQEMQPHQACDFMHMVAGADHMFLMYNSHDVEGRGLMEHDVFNGPYQELHRSPALREPRPDVYNYYDTFWTKRDLLGYQQPQSLKVAGPPPVSTTPAPDFLVLGHKIYLLSEISADAIRQPENNKAIEGRIGEMERALAVSSQKPQDNNSAFEQKINTLTQRLTEKDVQILSLQKQAAKYGDRINALADMLADVKSLINNADVEVFATPQEAVWRSHHGFRYVVHHMGEDWKTSRIPLWEMFLKHLKDVKTVCEFGCNIAANLKAIQHISPNLQLTGVEINSHACEVASQAECADIVCDSIISVDLKKTFDLVFSRGVLIHINPAEVPTVMKNMVRHANKYVLIYEHYSPTPIQPKSYASKVKGAQKGEGYQFWRDYCGDFQALFPEWTPVAEGVNLQEGQKPKEGSLHWTIFKRPGI